MRTAYQQQLEGLNSILGEMCELAGATMARATQALLQADLAVAELDREASRAEAIDYFGLDAERRTPQVRPGSLSDPAHPAFNPPPIKENP